MAKRKALMRSAVKEPNINCYILLQSSTTYTNKKQTEVVHIATLIQL